MIFLFNLKPVIWFQTLENPPIFALLKGQKQILSAINVVKFNPFSLHVTCNSLFFMFEIPLFPTKQRRYFVAFSRHYGLPILLLRLTSQDSTRRSTLSFFLF